MKHIERNWQAYRDRVISEHAPEVQVSECRMAFYAGAMSTFGEVQRVIGRSDDDGVAHLNELHQELHEYGLEILRQKRT